jgi:predicted O-methyltransferase YrrM
MKNKIVEILNAHDINGFEKPGGTDKDTWHNYTGSYERLLKPYEGKKINFLEIGVAYGGSALLWHEYLPDARFALVDIKDQVHQSIRDRIDPNRHKFYFMDAYQDECINTLINDFPDGFDVIVEDGPHTLESQIVFINKYLPYLKKGGIMIMEDIQSLAYIEPLKIVVPDEYKPSVEIVNLIHTRGRYDDLMFVVRKKDVINYSPKVRKEPRILQMSSAWGDIPSIIFDIIDRFGIKTKKALEFGVEYGYSTTALSNYFDEVTGVDIFTGDIHAGITEDHYESTKSNLSSWSNIELIKSDYRDFIKENNERYDLIHIDIIHTYAETFECGEWSVQHSDVVIFHDTESFPDVKRVCEDLSEKYNLDFYNYTSSFGLGILVKKQK